MDAEILHGRVDAHLAAQLPIANPSGNSNRGIRRWRWLAWVSAPVVALLACVLLWEHPIGTRTYSLTPTPDLPASLDFDATPVAFDRETQRLVRVLARSVTSHPRPVVIAAYADPSGNRDRNLRLAQKRAANVRDVLVTAGIPTLQVVLVSPTFAAASDAPRIEVSLVHGAQAFPGGTQTLR